MDSSDLWLEIITQMHQRREIGLNQYGVPVTADPAVDWFNHSEEEQLDNLVYTKAAKQLYLQLLKAAATLIYKSPEACKLIDEIYDRKDDNSFTPTDVALAWRELADCIPHSMFTDGKSDRIRECIPWLK